MRLQQKILAMKKYVKLYLVTIIGVIVGSVSGYLYWRFVGCSSGTCAITSSPINSTLYGALLGWTLFSMFETKKSK
jgi:F0F1-type ATP synthase assembly protein I